MAGVRFAVGVQRVLPFLGFHQVLMIILALSWILEALLLAGCTTSNNSLKNIYLLSVTYGNPPQGSSNVSTLFSQAARGGQILVRSAYFGLCAADTGQGGEWVCASGASGLKPLLYQGPIDPLNAIGVAARFKDDVVFPGLIIGAVVCTTIAFLLLATFPGWHEEHDSVTGSDIDVKPFPSRTVSYVVAFMMFVASIFLLASALWQHVAAASAASTIASTTQQYLKCSVGPAATVLVWASFVFAILVFMGIVVTILSIHLLHQLTDD